MRVARKLMMLYLNEFDCNEHNWIFSKIYLELFVDQRRYFSQYDYAMEILH